MWLHFLSLLSNQILKLSAKAVWFRVSKSQTPHHVKETIMRVWLHVNHTVPDSWGATRSDLNSSYIKTHSVFNNASYKADKASPIHT